MRFLEIAVEHYFEAKKNPEIGIIELLGFAFEFANATEKPNSGIISQLNYIKKNTTPDLLINSGMVDFVLRKMESRTTPKEISVRNIHGDIRNFRFSEFLKERDSAKIEIQVIISKMLRNFEFRPEVGKKNFTNEGSGYDEPG